MTKEHWKIDDLPWQVFNPQQLEPDLLPIVKAAAMVEFNAIKYEQYLCNVFSGDPIFQRAAKYWSAEEVQHGETLGRYAELADPSFDFKTAFARFAAGYNIDTATTTSLRGSHTGELIARCIVEVGTSSYYMALGDATQEPLLKAICHNIAQDEIRHYSMFYSHLNGYLNSERMNRFARLKIAWERIREVEDDELAYAYFAANEPLNASYNREKEAAAYMACAFPLYQAEHVKHMVSMVAKASGLSPHGFWHNPAAQVIHRLIQRKAQAVATITSVT